MLNVNINKLHIGKYISTDNMYRLKIKFPSIEITANNCPELSYLII